ncbi:MAG: CHRD domain-containing protein [Acidobacteriota bacterium]
MRKTFLVSVLCLFVAAFVSSSIATAAEGMKSDSMKSEATKSDTMKKSAKSKWAKKNYARVWLSAYPGVKTSAKGKAGFALSKDGKSIHYKVSVKHIKDVTMAHIHLAKDGMPGAIVVWLYPTTGHAPSLKAGNVEGVLVKGTITEDKIGGPMKGQSVKTLFDDIRWGKAGVVVHTKENPKGEIWGVCGKKTKGKAMEGKEWNEWKEKKEHKTAY